MEKSKHNLFVQFKALLDMIEPYEDYKGGTVHHEFAKQYYDFTKEYIDKLSSCLRRCEQIMLSQDLKQVQEYVGSKEYKELRKFIYDKVITDDDIED